MSNNPTFSMMISTPTYQKLINNTIKDPNRARRFVSAITSAVAVNPSLQECEASTILSGALLGESLNLSPSPQLGQYYLVPFKNKSTGITNAQFVLGYKGFVQLALRSGQYKRLNVISIKDGELIGWNPLTEECNIAINENDAERENLRTVGYLASFEYLNGFTKTIYWSKEKMIRHADRYSQAFSADAQTINARNGKTYRKVSFADYEAGNFPKGDEWMYSSFWYKDFDGMAYKTMLRQIISKWGVMSIDLQTADIFDGSSVQTDDSGNFVQMQNKELPQEQHTENQVRLGDIT